MSKPETVGAGVVAASHPLPDNDDDDMLVSRTGRMAAKGKGRRSNGSNNSTQLSVSVTSSSKYRMLSELRDETTSIMESVIFSVFLGFNLLCLLIGIICWDEGMGTLWIELDDKHEFEYDFGWNKETKIHSSNGIDFETSTLYKKDLEAAGEFFVLIVSVGAMMIISLLLVKLLDSCCECCARQRRALEERNLNDETESWDAFLFIMSVWYSIFQLIYLIAIIAFNAEFISSCSDWIEELERTLTGVNDEDINYTITQYECVEGWGMYFQYLNLILGFANIILLCQIRKSINLSNEIRKAQAPLTQFS